MTPAQRETNLKVNQAQKLEHAKAKAKKAVNEIEAVRTAASVFDDEDTESEEEGLVGKKRGLGTTGKKTSSSKKARWSNHRTGKRTRIVYLEEEEEIDEEGN